MIRRLFCLITAAWLSSVVTGHAQTRVLLCQQGDARLGVLTTHGNNSWGFAGSTSHITGWDPIRQGDCFRDDVGRFRTREYVFAAQASDGTVVPLDLVLQRAGSFEHRLRTRQICVPEGITDLGKIQLREGAQHPPCMPGERSYPASIFVIAGDRSDIQRINIGTTQADIDRLAGVASTPGDPARSSSADKSIFDYFDFSLQKPGGGQVEKKAPPDPDRWLAFVKNCMNDWKSTDKRPRLDTCICHEALYSSYGDEDLYASVMEDYMRVSTSHPLPLLKKISAFSRSRSDLCVFDGTSWTVPDHLQTRRAEYLTSR
jgi:hypothetical protein